MLEKLKKQDVIDVISFSKPSRPPIIMPLVCEPELIGKYGKPLQDLIAQYPGDIAFTNVHVDYWHGTEDEPDYRWAFGSKQKPVDVAIDDCPVIEDWSELEQFIEEMPSAYHDKPFKQVEKLTKENPDSYKLVSFGHYFNQKLASVRGINNLLYDFSDNQANLQKIMDAWIEYYKVLAQRVKAAGADGVYGGEDLGTQKSLFMSPDTYRKLFKPYHKKLAKILHDNDLHFWMHTCGNITEIMNDIIDAGIDVLHPIQPGAMNAEKTVAEYSGKITFYVGMDIQNLIPFGSPEEVAAGITERAEQFYNPKGGVVYGTANVIVSGTPLENIQAYIESLYKFCEEKIIGV